MPRESEQTAQPEAKFASAEELFPVIYEELKKLASQQMQSEDPNQSVTPTVLVHEAFLRLKGGQEDDRFENTRHLFVAAAEAMRWILIDRARARSRHKRGGGMTRVEFSESTITAPGSDEHLLAVNDALTKLEKTEPKAAQLVKMRFFCGFTLHEIAEALDVSYATIKRQWSFAKAWFVVELGDVPGESPLDSE